MQRTPDFGSWFVGQARGQLAPGPRWAALGAVLLGLAAGCGELHQAADAGTSEAFDGDDRNAAQRRDAGSGGTVGVGTVGGTVAGNGGTVGVGTVGGTVAGNGGTVAGNLGTVAGNGGTVAGNGGTVGGFGAAIAGGFGGGGTLSGGPGGFLGGLIVFDGGLPPGLWPFLDGGSPFPNPTTPPTPSQCYSDGDALSAEQEAEAGLDSCKVDSDGDGCSDTAEYIFGGCGDSRQVVTLSRCYGDDSNAVMSFYAPYREVGEWAKLTLVVDPGQLPPGARLNITALPSETQSASGASYLSVTNNVSPRLRFVVVADGIGPGITQIGLSLLGDSGQVLDRGTFVVAVEECPIVI
jgi:hypothetical protein